MNLTLSKKTLALAGALCGGLAVLLAIFGNPGNMAICVACFIRDTAGALKFHTAAPVQYMRPEIVGIVLGSFAVAAASKEYRSTAGSSPVIRFLLGIFMMIGALVFLGCPLRMVIRMSAGDLNAYIGLVGFALGILTGTIALKKGFSLSRNYETQKANGVVFPALLGLLLIVSMATSLLAVSEEGPGAAHAPLALALICGLGFGILAMKSRMCFAGSIRDIFLMKNFDLISIIGGFFVVMLIFNLASGNFSLQMAENPIAHTEVLWNILGMFVVGLAAVLAGGCPLRQLVLAGQGSADSVVTVLGMFTGAAICHNFGLASSADGTTGAGRIACVAAIAVLLVIGFGIKRKKA